MNKNLSKILSFFWNAEKFKQQKEIRKQRKKSKDINEKVNDFVNSICYDNFGDEKLAGDEIAFILNYVNESTSRILKTRLESRKIEIEKLVSGINSIHFKPTENGR